MHRSIFLPEGAASLYPRFQPISELRSAMAEGHVLTGRVTRCDRYGSLYVSFGGYEGTIAREEAVHESISGANREISVLSLVGQNISFVIENIRIDGKGRPVIALSRRKAQERAIEWLYQNAEIGSILPARVTHLADFGAFVDLGCGVISLVPLGNLSVSRAKHPSERVRVGENMLVVLTGIDRERSRFYLSHKELLGTWFENAAIFSPGDTVTGIVRAVREFGTFVELTRNLSALAPRHSDLAAGDAVSVLIRAIHPEDHRIKVQVIRKLDDAPPMEPPRYFITDGTVTDWVY